MENQQPQQLRLDVGEAAIWRQLPTGVRNQCVTLLSLLVREVWQAAKEEDRDEREDHSGAP